MHQKAERAFAETMQPRRAFQCQRFLSVLQFKREEKSNQFQLVVRSLKDADVGSSALIQ